MIKISWIPQKKKWVVFIDGDEVSEHDTFHDAWLATENI